MACEIQYVQLPLIPPLTLLLNTPVNQYDPNNAVRSEPKNFRLKFRPTKLIKSQTIWQNDTLSRNVLFDSGEKPIKFIGFARVELLKLLRAASWLLFSTDQLTNID